jgi:hypothetical protein
LRHQLTRFSGQPTGFEPTRFTQIIDWIRGFDARHPIVIEVLGSPHAKIAAIEFESRGPRRRWATDLAVSQPPMPPQDCEFHSRNCGYNFVLVT